jgi:hypothetical protein
VFALLILGGGIVWFIFSDKFDDTSGIDADYSIAADDLLAELRNGTTVVNKKYTEKILDVAGIVSEIESLDTLVNLKFTDSSTGNYLIFTFQDKSVPEANKLAEGVSVVVRGSCSGATHSDILDLNYISFKRSAIIKKQNNQK